MSRMGHSTLKQNNSISIKLFFVVIFLVGAYQIINLLRDEPEWKTYNPENKLFTLDVSGDPNRRIVEEAFKFGTVPFEFIMFSRGNFQYAISYAEIPETIAGISSTELAINASKKLMQSELIKVFKDSISSVSGQRVIIEASDGSELVQLIAWYRGYLFRLMVVGEGVTETQSSGDIEHFFQSFNFSDVTPNPDKLLFQ